jgi:prepilin-type N-terminal cleavage/methylation domain-containing protein
MFGYIKKVKRNAFTLSELLVALGVIGVLTAIVMPIVFSLAPDQNALMAKRAFDTTETVISNLLNDNTCYPKTLSRAGLDGGLGYTKCKKWGGKENTGSLTNEDAFTKLV